MKTRVDGQITEVLFKEGDLVNQGDVLFRLDDRLVKAQIAQAEAGIARDQATLRDAEATLARRNALIDKKIVTEAALDQARFAVEALKASIASGQALLETQKTQLDYLTIRAPITGRTGSLSAKVGAMVRGVDAAAALVTINQTKPIWVTFAVPQSELGALQGCARRQGAGRDPRRRSEAHGGAGDDRVHRQPGGQADRHDRRQGARRERRRGAVARALSAEVALTVEVKVDMLSVPASAVLPAQQGMIAWVIGPDNKVTPRTVKVERIVDQRAFLSRRRQGRRACRHRRSDPSRPRRDCHHRRAAPSPGRTPASEERRMNGRG